MQNQLWQEFNQQLDHLFFIVLMITLAVLCFRAMLNTNTQRTFDRYGLAGAGAMMIFLTGAQWFIN